VITQLDLLQWLGCATGIAGSALLATRHRYSALAWPLFLASNASWIAFGLMIGAAGMVTMQIAYTFTSVVGIRNWLVRA